VRVEPAPRRVRVYLGGEVVADTIRALYVWEKPYFPTYYVPSADVRPDALVATGETERSPSRGEAQVHTVKAGGREAPDAALWFKESPIAELADHVRFRWGAMDAWFEEDEEIFVHPRDPYTRVDVLPSSRHVEVMVDGVKVADSVRPRMLFETGLPTRYYLPKVDVRMDLLVPTDLETHCPYKGTANYYSVEVNGKVFENIVWWYKHPIAEAQQIAGCVSFYNEKVDVIVDGEPEERPKTPFS
jgi:uncharacterized protein (DUF427 family)